MAPHSTTLAWKIPWMEEPGRLQSMGSLGVGHDWATSLSLFTFMHWRRKWQPTPVFLPGEFQGRGSLVGCCLWGSHRVGHDWSNLAAAAAAFPLMCFFFSRSRFRISHCSLQHWLLLLLLLSLVLLLPEQVLIINWETMAHRPVGVAGAASISAPLLRETEWAEGLAFALKAGSAIFFTWASHNGQ